jgi:hypothetical protein
MSSVQSTTNSPNSIQWQYLQSLLSAGSASSSQKTGGSNQTQAFDPFAGLGGDATQTSGAGGCGPCPPFNLETMSALIDAQAQASSTSASSLSQHQQKVFGQLDADSNGSVTKTELENSFGADNKAVADYVMKKLDTDGDGAISKGEFAAGTTRGARHRHGPPPGQDLLAALMSATQGANSTSTSNSDGSSTTTITYADGSKVSMTSAASSDSDNSASANSSNARSNLLEQLIKLQAQLTGSATAMTSTTA